MKLLEFQKQKTKTIPWESEIGSHCHRPLGDSPLTMQASVDFCMGLGVSALLEIYFAVRANGGDLSPNGSSFVTQHVNHLVNSHFLAVPDTPWEIWISLDFRKKSLCLLLSCWAEIPRQWNWSSGNLRWVTEPGSPVEGSRSQNKMVGFSYHRLGDKLGHATALVLWLEGSCPHSCWTLVVTIVLRHEDFTRCLEHDGSDPKYRFRISAWESLP